MPGRSHAIAIEASRPPMDTYVSAAGSAPKTGILLIQEVFGVTQAIRDIADDLAGEGYLVMAPDLFWRLEPRVQLGNGEDPVLRARALDLLGRFDVEQGVEDLGAAAANLRAMLPAGTPIAVVGFCIGGRMAALVAAASKVDAAVSFYGVGLDRYLERLEKIKVPTAFYIGDQDAHIPSTTIDLVRLTIERSGNPNLALTLYPGAGHAFFNRHRADSFHPQAAAKAREALLAFLARHLR